MRRKLPLNRITSVIWKANLKSSSMRVDDVPTSAIQLVKGSKR